MSNTVPLNDPYEPGLSDREYWHRNAAVALSQCLENRSVIRWCAVFALEPGMPDRRPILLTPAHIHALLPDYDESNPYDSEAFSGALGTIESPADAHIMTNGSVLRPEHVDSMVIEALPSTAGVNRGCGWEPAEISLLLETYWSPRLGNVTFLYDEQHAKRLRSDLGQQVGGEASVRPEEYFTRNRDMEYGYDQVSE